MTIKRIMNSWTKWLATGLLGFFFYFAYSSKWSLLKNSSETINWFLRLYLFFLFSLIAYWILFKWAKPRLTILNFSSRFQQLWLTGMLLSGIFLAWAIPVEAPSNSLVNLEIIATGEKNTQSQGSEVWLVKVTGKDRIFDPSKFSSQGTWISKDNMLVATSPYPASLKIEIPDENVQLAFVSHPWSGKVKIIWNGESHLEDLYSKTGETRFVSLQSKKITPFQRVRTYFYFLSSGIAIGFFLYFISIWFLAKESSQSGKTAPTKGENTSRISKLLYITPAAIVSVLYLLAFWPGVMSPDSTDQWKQMLTGHFSDWHPVFHTLTNWLITRVWLSPASVALVQIVTLCALIYWGTNIQTRLGISKVGKIITSLSFSIPPIAMLIITLWKDIFYSLAVFALTLAILEIVMSDGKWITRKRNLIVLSVILSAVSLYRHNGLPVAIITIVVLIIAFKNSRKSLLLSTIIFGVCYIFVKYPLYGQLEITKGALNNPGNTFFIHHIGAHLMGKTFLTAQEKSILASVRPLDDSWGYNCLAVDSIVFSPKFNWEKMYASSKQLEKMTIDLFLRDPKVDVDNWLCASSFVWRIKRPENDNHSDFSIATQSDGSIISIYKNTLGLKSNSQIPVLERYLVKLLRTTKLEWMWRSAVYLYLLFFASAIFCVRKRSTRFLYFLLPVLIQTSFLLVSSIAQDFRYQFAICLVSIFSLGLLFAPRANEEDEALAI